MKRRIIMKDINRNELNQIIGGQESENAGFPYPIPTPTPIRPIVLKNCQHKPCSYKSKSQCPYYTDEIGDCNK